MKSLNEALQKIDALSVRERVILFVLLLAGIWAAMDTLLLAPQESARKQLDQKLAAARLQILEAEQALVSRANQPDPELAARQRLESARLHLDARLQTAARLQARMVAPKDRVDVLQGLLAAQPGLRLASLETLPPEAVGMPKLVGEQTQIASKEPSSPPSQPEDAASASAQEPTTALYKHGVKITLVGGYAALTRYMERLESLPVGFYWARSELDARAHPEISLTLILYTLSLEPTWLTV